MSLAIDNRRWYDILVAQEQTNDARLLRMSAAEWKEEGKRIIRNWRGDLRNCISYLDEIDARRAAVAQPVVAVVRPPKTEFDLDFAVWKDMVNEPEKYGDDICEWLELNDKLSSGSGRWRLGAFWCQKEDEEKAQEEARAAWEEHRRRVAAAIVLQAAIRGHLVRESQTFRDCCMCLSHRISPLETDVGMMCRGCAEQGPYTEETGPIADPWSEFRADYVDLAPEPEPEPEPEFRKCSWCFAPLDDGQTGNYCDYDCEYANMRDVYRGRD